MELRGKYNSAVVYTDNIEETAVSQIIALCDQEFTKGSKIRIMPDVHSGKGCVIGTTMTLTDKLVPNLVGVDIGCGMHTVLIDADVDEIDFPTLDKVIFKHVPLGNKVRASTNTKFFKQLEDDLARLRCHKYVNIGRAMQSIGTLGGGNHFIELDVDDDGQVYLVIHTGSRNIGKQVAVYYQNVAFEALMSQVEDKDKLIKELRASGREKDIATELKKLPAIHVSKDVAYLEGQAYEDYLHDMKIMQKYADLNRKAIADAIMIGMRWKEVDAFSTIHNYIDMEDMILRKGAVSAKKGEKLLIPISSQDGAFICIGKGNPDWNFSAPHGAGRLMSRKKAKELLSVADYQRGLADAGVYSTTANQSTLDESSEAYKPIAEIKANIAGTVDILKHIRPIYNMKAGE